MQELQSSNDRNWQIARARLETISTQLQRVSEKIIRRRTLAQNFVNFRHQAEQVLFIQ